MAASASRRCHEHQVDTFGDVDVHLHDKRIGLNELIVGPYFVLAAKLGERDLCATDATCRMLHNMNRTFWRQLGAAAFHGLELERDGIFEERDEREREARDEKHVRIDWKNRYRHFRTEITKFRDKFNCAQITEVRNPDEVAYCKCFLRTDILSRCLERGVYLEVEVSVNADNLSLVIVDFDEGGKSSVTFSPDTGAVIRERKIQESPRSVKGAYIQPLAPRPDRFEGQMGLYVRGSHVAFFRRYEKRGASPSSGSTSVVRGPWETTGFVIDLRWAEGSRLTPCLAFRDEGSYHVTVSRLGAEPPMMPQRLQGAYDEANWRELNWEGGQPIEI